MVLGNNLEETSKKNPRLKKNEARHKRNNGLQTERGTTKTPGRGGLLTPTTQKKQKKTEVREGPKKLEGHDRERKTPIKGPKKVLEKKKKNTKRAREGQQKGSRKKERGEITTGEKGKSKKQKGSQKLKGKIRQAEGEGCVEPKNTKT